VPEFEAALRTLPEGGISSAPVLSRHGWHIIRLNATAPGQVLPYDTVRPKIAQALEKSAWARASRDFVESLAQGAQISGASLAPI
jgi:peptidyl-prolyl cis-trans isomerase C